MLAALKKLFGSKPTSAMSQRPSVKPHLETLEGRDCPAVGVSVIAGDLIIEGTNYDYYNDYVTVDYYNSSYISVNFNGGIQYFAKSQLTTGNIFFHGYAGNDYFSNNMGSMRSWAYGGTGNDTLIGDALVDSLFGEDGNDYLYGYGGNDYMDGGNGEDHMYGGSGNDRMIAGYDYSYNYLDGGFGNDSMYGGYGQDWMDGSYGDDYLAGNYGDDWLFGGSGYDWIYGEGGNDYLNGSSNGQGDDGSLDYLVGGSGGDYFVNFSRDNFADFNSYYGDRTN